MDKNKCRIVKIGKEALYEFIYESFIANQENILKIDAIGVSNNFAINWENVNFIFLAHSSEDEDENFIPFPKDIDLQELMKKLPDTTNTILTEKPFKEYSFNELREILSKDEN